MPAPSAQACSEATTRIGMPRMSAVTCMTKGLLRAMPPWAMTALMGTPSLRNCSTMARDAERRGLHQRAEDLRRRGAQGQADDGALQRLVGERRPPAVQPVQRCDSGLSRVDLRGLRRKPVEDRVLDLLSHGCARDAAFARFAGLRRGRAAARRACP